MVFRGLRAQSPGYRGLQRAMEVSVFVRVVREVVPQYKSSIQALSAGNRQGVRCGDDAASGARGPPL